jgi:diguanylate cyclase (GGDEF)-like protein/PAS domain S-box-containing protein
MEQRILLVVADPVVSSAIQGALSDAKGGPFILEWVSKLSEGLACMKEQVVTAVFLDLFLPDSQGIDTFSQLSLTSPYVPIIVLSTLADENTAKEAVNRGAYDYLLKNRLDGYSLVRALHSVIARKAAEDALFLEKERAQITLNSIGDAVITTDISGNITYLNEVAEMMTGWSSKDASGRPFSEVFNIVDGDTRKSLQNPMELAVTQDQTVRLTSHCVLIRRDGSEAAIEDSTAPIRARTGEVVGAVMVFHDVGEAQAMALKMTRFAQHDLLTGLPNRLLLHDRIAQAISLSRRQRKQLAILFLDLDGFKQVNDALGHEVGDKLLRLVAKRTIACVRGSDTVSRLGGDEFVILLPEIADARDAEFTGSKILAALAEPCEVAGNNLQVTGCIGISVYPQNGRTTDLLIKSADTAMYQAKRKGPNTQRLSDPTMNVPEAVGQRLDRTPDRQGFLSQY